MEELQGYPLTLSGLSSRAKSTWGYDFIPSTPFLLYSYAEPVFNSFSIFDFFSSYPIHFKKKFYDRMYTLEHTTPFFLCLKTPCEGIFTSGWPAKSNKIFELTYFNLWVNTVQTHGRSISLHLHLNENGIPHQVYWIYKY